MQDRIESGKHCFVYCGDDKCDCSANPRNNALETLSPIEDTPMNDPKTIAGHFAVAFILALAFYAAIATAIGSFVWMEFWHPFRDPEARGWSLYAATNIAVLFFFALRSHLQGDAE